MIGFRQARDAVERREEVAAIGLDEGLLVHLLDVDAGGERLLVAGDDDAADRGIGLEAVERAVDLADQLGVERVQRVRAVERDDPDLALGRDEDRFIGAVRFRRLGFWFRGGEDIQEHDRFSPLVLTGWTIESRPSSLDDAAYGSSAAFSRARFALAAIDLESELEFSERAVGALVVAERRAAGPDGVLEHRLHAIDQRLRLFGVGLPVFVARVPASLFGEMRARNRASQA